MFRFLCHTCGKVLPSLTEALVHLRNYAKHEVYIQPPNESESE